MTFDQCKEFRRLIKTMSGFKGKSREQQNSSHKGKSYRVSKETAEREGGTRRNDFSKLTGPLTSAAPKGATRYMKEDLAENSC